MYQRMSNEYLLVSSSNHECELFTFLSLCRLAYIHTLSSRKMDLEALIGFPLLNGGVYLSECPGISHRGSLLL